MKQNCTPPYENCAHGHFYRAALASGIAESEAVKLTERLKKLHDLDYFRSLDKYVLNISQAIKKAIAGLPPQVQGEAARVLYEVLHLADSLGVNPKERIQIEKEFGNEFLRDLKKQIRADFHAALQGETYIHTYEMWLKGGYSKPPQNEIYNTATRRWESDIMPDGEYQKIVAKQKAIAEDHVQKNLTWYIEQFESQLSKSEAKERFIRQEMEMYESILYDKDFTGFVVIWEIGKKKKYAKNWTTSEHGWKNGIAYWVDQVIVKAIRELHEFVKPDDDGKYHREIEPINAKVLYEYHKYLEKRRIELSNDQSDDEFNPSENSLSVDKDEFFQLLAEIWNRKMGGRYDSTFEEMKEAVDQKLNKDIQQKVNALKVRGKEASEDDRQAYKINYLNEMIESTAKQIDNTKSVVRQRELEKLREHLEDLKNPAKSDGGKQQAEITFENLFVSTEAKQTAIDLAKRSGLVKIKDSKYEYCMGAKGKYAIVAYWHFLKDRDTPALVNFHPGQKACEVIAQHFGTTIGKNLWSENEKLPTDKGQEFYRKLVNLFGNSGKTGTP
jgi:hypothetical protein